MSRCDFRTIKRIENIADLGDLDISTFVKESEVRDQIFYPFRTQFVARSLSETQSWATWYTSHQAKYELSDWPDKNRDFQVETQQCPCGNRRVEIILTTSELAGSTAYGISFRRIDEDYFLCEE